MVCDEALAGPQGVARPSKEKEYPAGNKILYCTEHNKNKGNTRHKDPF